jgi:hypothetical protein
MKEGDGIGSWGEKTSATFIEHATNWDPDCFNIFRHSLDNGEGKEKRLFVVNRYFSTSNWWSDLNNTPADDCEYTRALVRGQTEDSWQVWRPWSSRRPSLRKRLLPECYNS